MTQVPLQGIGMRGLNQDTPSFAQDHTTFNSGLNLRPLNGSLQGVWDFGSLDTNINGPVQAVQTVNHNSLNPSFDSVNSTTNLTIGNNHGYVPGQLVDFYSSGGAYKFTAIVISVIGISGVRLRRFLPGTGPVTPTSTENLRNSDDNNLPVIADGDQMRPQTRDIYAMTQWTNTSSGKVNVAYLFDFDKADSETDTLGFQVVQDVEGTNTLITGALAATRAEYDEVFDIDFFQFNDLLILNDGVNQPTLITNTGTEAAPVYSAQFILGWLSRGRDNLTQTEQNTMTEAELSLFDQLNQRSAANRITCERMTTYNNRLIALNISDNYVDGGNAAIAWSTPITQLGNLNGVNFVPSTTNTAGDDIITETPGQVLDAGQLSNYLMVYKSDSVFAVQDSGDPLYLISQQIFGDDGLLAPGCWADIGNGKHFVVGNNGIYIHDGGVNKQNVSKGRVEDFFYNSLQEKNSVFVFHHHRDKEVWVCFRNKGDNSPGPNKALVYNYELDAWHQRQLGSIATTSATRGMTSTNLGGEYAVYRWGGDGVFKLNSDPTASTAFVQNGSAEFDKHDLGDSTMTKRVHALYPQTTNPIRLSLKTTDDLAADPNFQDSDRRLFNPSDGYKTDFRLYGRYFDLRLEMLGPTNPQLTGITFDITPGGRR